ncbi:MAG: YeeE/YedE family protein [Acidobacteria bacterium]|nr:YeeE/YedE family protein [Acidobacteriota bacterium]
MDVPFWIAGAGIGVLVVLLALVTGKGFGVSSGYGSLCSLVSGLPYFQQKPFTEKWRLWFIAGIPLGGFLAAGLRGDLAFKLQMGMFEDTFGDAFLTKILTLLIGGFLVGFGSRWAGG